MPMYEYRCEDCGERFEKLVRSSSSQEPIGCPNCGGTDTRKQFSTFASVGVRAGVSSAPACAPGGG